MDAVDVYSGLSIRLGVLQSAYSGNTLTEPLGKTTIPVSITAAASLGDFNL